MWSATLTEFLQLQSLAAPFPLPDYAVEQMWGTDLTVSLTLKFPTVSCRAIL